MDVVTHRHYSFVAAVAAIAGGVTLAPASPGHATDGGRAYFILLSEGDHARFCVDADGSANLSVFDRGIRRYVADLSLDHGRLSGRLGDMDVEERLNCAGVDVAELVSALRDATIGGGPVFFAFGMEHREAA